MQAIMMLGAELGRQALRPFENDGGIVTMPLATNRFKQV
jgi:hypothetical protein